MGSPNLRPPIQPPLENAHTSRLQVFSGEMFGAFRHYNFRVYFIGLFISFLGVWAQNVAQNWLVYDLTDSALVLGQVSFLMALPVLLMGPLPGVIIDRFPRRTILMITQVVLMAQAFTLAGLDFSGRILIWHVMVLAFVRGAVNAFDGPSRQSIIVELVGKEDMANGIALNSTMISIARTFGPALGGIIVGALGTAWGFTINGVTFLAILISLAMLRLEPAPVKPREQSPFADLADGLRYIWQHPPIVGLLVLTFSVALFGTNYVLLMPVYAVEVLGKGEVEYGLLSAANGLGTLIGALLVTYLSRRNQRGRILNVINIAFPIVLTVFTFTRSMTSAMIILVVVGVTSIPQLAMINMLVQSQIPDEIRGRVMTVFTLLVFGGFPLGGLIAGAVAEQVGAPGAILFSAVMVLVAAIGVRAVVPSVRDVD